MAAERPNRLRCAIYTRKSSEDGLEQDFNSLHAQREACEAYIRSQTGEGWQLIGTAYDDGAWSGGTMERPALQRLLADIAAGKIDVVVVYKVDRLTRSLADFAKIVDVFDARNVSFVSVTQQFNTTTSMGRLTLNMLLSFAQFEREVTGERIRDKIAASKKKGMWMGGFVPLGYDARTRTLVINEPEAGTVRTVFRLYLEHGNVRRVKHEADRLGLRTKLRQAGNGRMRGGRPLSRGYIYKLLNNPIYIGRIVHKDEIYDGLHEAIIDAETWEAVQAKLAGNLQGHRSRAGAAEPSLLAGLVYNDAGTRLSPSHAVKNGRRYRYYVSQRLITDPGSEDEGERFRIPAHEIEALVIRALKAFLLSRTRLFDLLHLDRGLPARAERLLACAQRLGGELGHRNRSNTVRRIVDRVVVATEEIRIVLSMAGLRDVLGLAPNHRDVPRDRPDGQHLTIPARLKRCGGATKLILNADDSDVSQEPDPALVRLISRAHHWYGRLATGQDRSAADLARTEGLTRSYVTRVIRLAFLAPDITEAILDGREPADLNAERLVRRSRLPLDWHEQRRMLGFS